MYKTGGTPSTSKKRITPPATIFQSCLVVL